MTRAPLLLLLSCLTTGCVGLDDARLEGRLRRMARAAYTTSPAACHGVAHSVDYAKGFEDGYYDVASGGDGCPPALPPKKYWRAAYGSPVGQEHVDAWFQGFRDGAAAARAEGAASFGVIRVSAEHRYGMERSKNTPRVVLPYNGPPIKPPPEVEPSVPPPLPDALPVDDWPGHDSRSEPSPAGRDRTPPPAPMPPTSNPRKEQPRPTPERPPAVPIPTTTTSSPKSSRLPVSQATLKQTPSTPETDGWRLSLPKRTID